MGAREFLQDLYSTRAGGRSTVIGRLAAEHAREQGQHDVKIESRDDYRRREMARRPQHPRSI